MEKDSRIFVAGGTGMVGNAIINKLLATGYTKIISSYHKRKPSADTGLQITFVQLDLTLQSDVESFFGQERPEYVILAAAKVGGILANNIYKAEFIYDNLAIALNVVNSAYKYGAKKLLNLGSSCIYPKFAPQPMREEHLLTGILEPTNEPYAIAKISTIKLCRYYNEQYGTNFISVMPTNLYGPNDNFDLKTSHILPALVRKMHLGKCLQKGDYESIRKDLKKYPLYDNEFLKYQINNLQSSPPCEEGNQRMALLSEKFSFNIDQLINSDIISLLSKFGVKMTDSTKLLSRTHHLLPPTVIEIWGSGEPFREFLHVNDLADACVFLMNHYSYKDIGEFVNIGTGEDIKIKDIANLIKKIVGFNGAIDHDLSKPDGTPRKLLEVSKIKALGWKPTIGLEEGIRKTYEWYVSSLQY